MAVAAKILDMGVSADVQVIYLTDIENTGIDDLMQGPCTLYAIVIDNTGNAEEEFFKLYDAVNPTIGTDDPTWEFQVTASLPILIPMQLPTGVSFTNGLSVACSQEIGADCTTAPTASVNATLFVRPA